MNHEKRPFVAGNTVREFIKDLAIWVRGMLHAFRKGGSGPSIDDTWDDFKPVADLLEEIFKWANSRLNDRGLQRATQGWKVPGKLDEFRGRLTTARSLFKETSIVTASRAHDHQTQLLNTIWRSQEDEERIGFLDERLRPRVEATAIKEPCHPGTREEIFADIGRWVFDTSLASPRLFWVTGMPGSGKSAIAVSVAKEFEREGLLWAQYFFDRHDSETTDATKVFRSVAWQLVKDRSRLGSAEVVLSIFDTLQLERNKNVPKTFDHSQVQHLFIDPLKEAARCDLTRPVIIVFDALDEGKHEIRQFSRLLANSIQSLPPNVKIFVTFRPDTEVTNTFASLQGKGARSQFLDTDDQSSQTDIEFFIRDRLREIVHNFNSNREDDRLEDNWIGESDIKDICIQSSGLFLWAKTTIIFIEDRLKKFGKRPTKIKEMLTILKTKPFEAAGRAEKIIEPIGGLYTAILQSIYPPEESESNDVDEFRRIVGAVVMLTKPLCLRNLRALLYPSFAEDIEGDVGSGSGSRIEDVPDFQNLFLPLRSIFKPNAATIVLETIPDSHKSFVDFIQEPLQSGYFCINPTMVHEDLALRCLEHLQTLPHNSGDVCSGSVERSNSTWSPLRYACHHWEHHLLYASPDGCNIEAFDNFARSTLLDWIGAISVLKSPQDTLNTLESARTWRSRSPRINTEIMKVVSHFHSFLSTLIHWDLKHSHWDEEHFRLSSEELRSHFVPDVFDWLHDQTTPPLLWVTGSPGIGKSTLARTIARSAAEESVLGAGFFSRWDERYTMDLILRDVAFQLCCTIPHFILKLFRMGEKMKASITLSFSQIQELMTESARVDLLPKPLLIVIDALDESDGHALSLLHMFTRCFNGAPSLKLLVTSRFTPVECHAFSQDEFEEFGRILTLTV